MHGANNSALIPTQLEHAIHILTIGLINAAISRLFPQFPIHTPPTYSDTHCPSRGLFTKMLDTLMTKSNYAELAKQTNSIGAAFSTVFLFTRLWARSTQYKGLWWDDYLCKLDPLRLSHLRTCLGFLCCSTLVQYSVHLEKPC